MHACDKEKLTTAVLDPDVVLASAMGVFDRLVVIGYNKDGSMDAFGSLNFPNEEIVFAIEKFKHKIMAGDYGKSEDRG